MKLKLDKNTEGSSNVKFSNVVKLKEPSKLFPKGYKYPVGRLVEVKVVETEKEEMGEVKTTVRLDFVYKEEGADKKGSLLVREFAPADNDKFSRNLDYLNRRIIHIYEQTVGGKFPDSIEAENFKEYFTKIAEVFNNAVYVENDKEKKLFSRYPVYIKIVYGTGDNSNRQQLPLFPNFLERAVNAKLEKVPCSLDLGNRDIIEPTAQTTPSTFIGGGAMNTSFGGSEDFPDDLD